MIKQLYNFLTKKVPTLFYCLLSGLPYDITWNINGRLYVNRTSWFIRKMRHRGVEGGIIKIGKYFSCNNKLSSNSIGIFQPCFFNISTPRSKLLIGNNVGISGTTINATTTITIGDNTLIGSGCLITDTDSHPIYASERLLSDSYKFTKSKPISDCYPFHYNRSGPYKHISTN